MLLIVAVETTIKPITRIKLYTSCMYYGCDFTPFFGIPFKKNLENEKIIHYFDCNFKLMINVAQ